jgi:hypothetical protein
MAEFVLPVQDEVPVLLDMKGIAFSSNVVLKLPELLRRLGRREDDDRDSLSFLRFSLLLSKLNGSGGVLEVDEEGKRKAIAAFGIDVGVVGAGRLVFCGTTLMVARRGVVVVSVWAGVVGTTLQLCASARA